MIPLYMPFLKGNEKKYVNDCLDSTWISSKGKYVERFEKGFADFIGTDGAVSVSNGTVALHLALKALGIGFGDEVIVPSFTYIASVNTIAQTGAIPVFVDSDKTTWQMSPDSIREKITPRTKAVMVVHLYGHPCDMDSICRIREDHKLFLIEDCAEAIGSYYKGRHVGTFGDCGAFSFFGNKTITTGEGGMVIAKNKELLEKCRHLKGQGMSPSRRYWHDCIGYNYRMTNIQAAIGLAQLEQTSEILRRKKNIAGKYAGEFMERNLPLSMLREHGTDLVNSYWLCTFAIDNAFSRDEFADLLDKDYGIETRPAFYLAHEMPMYKDMSPREGFDNARTLSRSGINLPSYPDLTGKELDYIIDSVEKVFNILKPAEHSPRPDYITGSTDSLLTPTLN
jgi:perosamine synthetase